MNWNIINKGKSKQNITRDIEIKNSVTIATGEWGGDSGERGLWELLWGTWGTRMGSRGRVEMGEGGGTGWGGVEGRGENADNRN